MQPGLHAVISDMNSMTREVVHMAESLLSCYALLSGLIALCIAMLSDSSCISEIEI